MLSELDVSRLTIFWKRLLFDLVCEGSWSACVCVQSDQGPHQSIRAVVILCLAFVWEANDCGRPAYACGLIGIFAGKLK